MDNLTHTLFGLTLARTPLGRAGRGTTTALVIASNAPDLDIVSNLAGPGGYLTWHRGPTHGPLGVIGLGLLTAAVVWAGRQYFDSQRDHQEDRHASFGMLVVAGSIGVLMHVLMDLPTPYGTRLLSPFDWHWYSTDWMPIIDVYLLVVLAAGLMFGRGSMAAKRRNAAIVLVLVMANYGLRGVAHHQALADAPRLFGPLLPPPCDSGANTTIMASWPPATPPTPPEAGKRCLVEMVAIPTFFSPFTWRVIAHLSNAFELQDLDLLDPRFRRPPRESEVMWRTTLRVPNVWTPAVFTAASSPLGQTFLGFARLPAARSFVEPTGAATVRWSDVRFAASFVPLDQPTRNNALFTLRVRVAPDGRVVQEQLGP